MMPKLKVLITGSKGFIGKNLVARLSEIDRFNLVFFTRGEGADSLRIKILEVDVIIHLAGENRPSDIGDYKKNNTDLTHTICKYILETGRNIPLIFASSTQVLQNNPYGISKRAAENIIEEFVHKSNNGAVILRLPGVFGKWAKPNYNSVVSTFCFNVSRSLPITIIEPERVLNLVYIDDLIDKFIEILDKKSRGLAFTNVEPSYQISVKELAAQILKFYESRDSLYIDRVGIGLTRALYSTYISYLSENQVTYNIPKHIDDRGLFVEMLKTPDCGQISYFTIHPKLTRGSHYHHTKTEKFLVVCGEVVMKFRCLTTGEKFKVNLSSKKPEVVDSIPGWVHDITNVGNVDAIVMLWANEVFNQNHPDCIPCKV
jgi:UDP-2-acetamido-2,6-beta-L-arabino-hexul-4-ose reductase